jgi:hypothetical protein
LVVLVVVVVAVVLVVLVLVVLVAVVVVYNLPLCSRFCLASAMTLAVVAVVAVVAWDFRSSLLLFPPPPLPLLPPLPANKAFLFAPSSLGAVVGAVVAVYGTVVALVAGLKLDKNTAFFSSSTSSKTRLKQPSQQRMSYAII